MCVKLYIYAAYSHTPNFDSQVSFLKLTCAIITTKENYVLFCESFYAFDMICFFCLFCVSPSAQRQHNILQSDCVLFLFFLIVLRSSKGCKYKTTTTVQFNVTHINYISFCWHNNATRRTNMSLANFVLKHLLCVILNYFFNVRSNVIQIVWFIYNNDDYHFLFPCYVSLKT